MSWSAIGYLLLASDQRSGLKGEVVAVSLKRPQGREFHRQLRSEELEDPLWPEEVLQAMLAEIP